MQRRVAAREPGVMQQALVARVATLEALLNDARLETFAVNNDGRDITTVARDVLSGAGWPGGRS